MDIVVNLLVGIGWGALTSVVNFFISRRYLTSRSVEALTRYKQASNGITLSSVAIAFVLCQILPLRLGPVMIGAVLTIPLLNALFLYRTIAKLHANEEEEETAAVITEEGME